MNDQRESQPRRRADCGSAAGESKPARLASLDAFRGFIMIVLALEGFNCVKTAKNLGYGPDAAVDTWTGWIWQTLAFHMSHPQCIPSGTASFM